MHTIRSSWNPDRFAATAGARRSTRGGNCAPRLYAQYMCGSDAVRVFRACIRGTPVKDVAREFDITTRAVLLTVLRVDRIFRQHARRHYQAALRAEVG